MVKKDSGIQVIARDILPGDDIVIISDPEPAIEVFHHVTEEDLFAPEKFESFIEILNASVDEASGDGQIDLDDAQHLLGVGGENFGPKFVLEAILRNKATSDEFCNRVRANLPSVLNSEVEPYKEINQRFLYSVSERWKLPLMIVKLGDDPLTGHYTLALKNPEQKDDGSWHVLIADPTRPGERWHDLPNNWSELGSQSVIINEAYQNNKDSYDLTFPGDLQTAENIKLLESKSDRLQFDAYNCGLYCLFIAAVRTALKGDQFSGFNMLGIPQIEEDTKIVKNGQPLPGIEILTRSQLGI